MMERSRAYGAAFALVLASFASPEDYEQERRRMLTDLAHADTGEEQEEMLTDWLDALVTVTVGVAVTMAKVTGQDPATWILSRHELLVEATSE